MNRATYFVCRILGVGLAAWLGASKPAQANEIWVTPTYQQDLGGLGIASNAIWPVTPIGAVRFVWPIPADLQTFQSAKVVLIPASPAGPANVNILVCAAQNGTVVTGSCSGPSSQAYTGVANDLTEVEIGSLIASHIGTPGANYLAVIAYTTPTTTTDHIVGLRFAYTPTTPAGVATLASNTFTGTQTAPSFVGSFSGDGSGLTNVATLGPNTFSGNQAIIGSATISGNLGIGTSTPTSRVEILGQDGLAISGFEPFLTLRDTGAGNARALVSSGGGDLGFWTNSSIGTFPPVVIKNGTGNVGIGTTTPTAAKLQVNDTTVGTGVFGLSSLGSGVFGQSTSSVGVGLYGRNQAGGYALYTNGNAGQDRDKGGLVKAMLFVNPDGSIARCYNAVTNSSSGGCGISVTHVDNGIFIVDFNFMVIDRFWSLTVMDPVTACPACRMTVQTNETSSSSPDRLEVDMQNLQDLSPTDAPFSLIVF